MDPKDYFERKKALLKDCVTLTEDVLSNINDIGTVNNLLLTRGEKISLLQELDSTYDKAMAGSLSEAQKTQIDQLVSLLLGLSRDTIKKIQRDQVELKKLMKVNAQNHKLIGYTGKYTQTSGRLLDKKK